jgi:hypothetical protein
MLLYVPDVAKPEKLAIAQPNPIKNEHRSKNFFMANMSMLGGLLTRIT